MARTNTFRYIDNSNLGWHLELKEGDAAKDYSEWLWLDGDLDNGGRISLGLFAQVPEHGEDYIPEKFWKGHPERKRWPAVDIHVWTPDGKVFRGVELVAPEEFQPLPFGAKWGNRNSFVGKIGPDGLATGYDIKLSTNDAELDVKANAIVNTGVVFSDEEHGYSYYNPITKRAVGWWPLVPKSEFEGTLKIEGKTTKVKGKIYCERQLITIPIEKSAQRWWFWGHLSAGEYTAAWTDSAASPHFNYRHFTPFVLWKGNVPILSTFNFACYAEQFAMDPVTGVPYPAVESLRAQNNDIEFTAQIMNGKVTNRLGWYCRQASDARIQVKHWGKTEEVSGTSVHEFGADILSRDKDPWFPVQFPLKK